MNLRAGAALALVASGCVDFSALTRDYGADAGTGTDGGSACPSFALLCEGFESGLSAWEPDPKPANFISTAVEAGVAHSGAHALMSRVQKQDSGHGGANAIISFFQPVASGTLALRAYWMSPAMVGPYATSMRLSPDGGTQANFVGYQVGLKDTNDWYVQRDPLMPGSSHTTGFDPDAGVWDCVELVLEMPDGGAPGHVTLYVNGQAGVSFDDATLDATIPQYGALSIGVVNAYDTMDETRYLDDVVLATQRIGCE